MPPLSSKPSALNPAQLQAVTSDARYLLIMAGPGTGKTHTLTQRIVYQFPKLAPEKKFLAVTFTNKAAQEMRERISAALAEGTERIFIGTFHKFCLGLLREFYAAAGLPKDFQIVSVSQIQAIAKELWGAQKLKEIRERLDAISFLKNTASKELSAQAAALRGRLRQEGLLDLDDILYETFLLLRNDAAVRMAVQARYGHIFVDEYQDINSLQHEILKLLAGDDAALTVIGDVHQAIYGFRGSNASFFESFLADFPLGARVSLSENYRSSPSLLEAAGQVIGAGEAGKTGRVAPLIAAMHRKGHLITRQAASARAEAEYVVHEIEKLVGGTSMFSKDSKRVTGEEEAGFSFGDMAVLYRLNSQSAALREAFERSGIPFQVSGARALSEEEAVREIFEQLCTFRAKAKEALLDFLSHRKAEHPYDALERIFDLASNTETPGEFLDDLLLQKENDGHDPKAQKVSLMTLHAAKGLEFGVVFIVGCEDGLLPLRREGRTTDMDEERRLFYVGMTRAKERLYFLSTAKRPVYGRIIPTAPSPFVEDIEARLKEEGAASSGAQRRRQTDGQLKLFT